MSDQLGAVIQGFLLRGKFSLDQDGYVRPVYYQVSLWLHLRLSIKAE